MSMMVNCLNKTQDIKHLSSVQYSSIDKLLARWNLYTYSEPEIDIHNVGIKHLDLIGDEKIFEAGCGNGQVLLKLRRNSHFGDLVGIDINQNIFDTAYNAQIRENLLPIKFIVGSADDLPFPDNSFDVVLAFFMLYHMPDINKTLSEWKRILKPNGKFLIATASFENKPKHKNFKRKIENIIEGSNSPQLSYFFNLENAEGYLKKYFRVVDRFVYQGKIKIKEPYPYLMALDSIKDMFSPTPSSLQWDKARNIIKEAIQKEIKENGYFTDAVKRGFFICENIK